MNKSMGSQFVWWIGVVEDRHDPLYLGRCKVRCLGWHTENKELVPTNTLPWAYPLMPITSASQTAVGTTPLGLVEGSWVMGFFRDGSDAQDPVIMGSFHGIPEQDVAKIYTDKIGFYDSRAYDIMEPDENEFGRRSATKNVRSLLGGENFESNLVPREPKKLEFYGDGTGVKIFEQIKKSPFPDKQYLREPTTNRLARGYADASTKLKSSAESNTIVSPLSILKRKHDSRNSGQTLIRTSGDFGAQANTTILKTITDFDGQPTATDISVPEIRPSITFFSEPSIPYNAKYPYNHVTQTESGHILEFDDTPSFERIHLYHRAGSFMEYHPTGSVVFKSVSSQYNIVHENQYTHIDGQKLETIDKGYQLFVNKDRVSKNGNFSIKIGTGGSYFANVENGNYFVTTRHGTFSTYGEEFSLVTLGSSIIGDSDKLSIASNRSTVFDTGNFNVSSGGSIDLTGLSVNLSAAAGGVNIFGTVGAINLTTVGKPLEKGGGIKLQTGLGGIELISSSMTMGTSGIISLSCGDNKYVSSTIMTLGGIETVCQNYVLKTITGPIKLATFGGSNTLGKEINQLIKLIKAITVPTGTGPSGVPINAPAFDTWLQKFQLSFL